MNITDGRYVYMRSGRMKSEGHLNNYTLLPLHMFEMFSLKELKEADRTLSDAFSFTKGAPVMKIPATPESSPQNTCYMYDDHLKYGDLLFDLQTDPREENPIQDPAVESRMVEAMSRLLHSSEAPRSCTSGSTFNKGAPRRTQKKHIHRLRPVDVFFLLRPRKPTT